MVKYIVIFDEKERFVLEISMEQVLNVLMSRMESINAGMEDLRFRMNVMGTALVDSGKLTEEDVKSAVRKQLNVMKYIDAVERVDESSVEQLTTGIMNWFNCDMSAIKAELEMYEKMMKEATEKMQAQQSSKIEVPGSEIVTDFSRRNKF